VTDGQTDGLLTLVTDGRTDGQRTDGQSESGLFFCRSPREFVTDGYMHTSLYSAFYKFAVCYGTDPYDKTMVIVKDSSTLHLLARVLETICRVRMSM